VAKFCTEFDSTPSPKRGKSGTNQRARKRSLDVRSTVLDGEQEAAYDRAAIAREALTITRQLEALAGSFRKIAGETDPSDSPATPTMGPRRPRKSHGHSPTR
jgi:hypothetical protein